MAHPLSGADLATLARVVSRAGLPSKPLKATGIAASVLCRQPFSLAERLIMEGRLPSATELAPPVFLLGHWRSGTTHLYNILAKSGEFGYVPPVATGLPWDIFGIGRMAKPLLDRALPEHRYIDNIPVTPESPQEDEIAIANMCELSFYHGIYFPRAFLPFLKRGLFLEGCSQEEISLWKERFVYLLRKLSHLQGGRQMMIKNPVYTGRFAMLMEMFPSSKFVHIHRNPYDVFLSMRNFWRKLLQEFALQDFGHVDIDETIFSVYDQMMSAFEEDARDAPETRFIELRYDDLDADPIGTIEDVYSGLGLHGFEEAKPKFEAYLASVTSFKKNKFTLSDADAAKVADRMGRFIEKWGYTRPLNA
ncbi:MAG: sulfotransferase [Pseudomonadota bacterium]